MCFINCSPINQFNSLYQQSPQAKENLSSFQYLCKSLCSKRDDLPKYDTPIRRLSLKIPSHTIILHNVFHKITSSRAPISINLKIRTRHVSFTSRERTATNLVAKILIARNQLRALWLLNVVQCQLNLHTTHQKKKKNQTFLIKKRSIERGEWMLTPRLLLFGHCLHCIQLTHMISLPVSTCT